MHRLEWLDNRNVRSAALGCLALLCGIVLLPREAAAACRQPQPPQSFCGDPGCGTVVCNTADASWECLYPAYPGTPCPGGGYCDGAGTCTANPPIVTSSFNNSSGKNACGCIDAQWSAPRGALVLIDSGDSGVKRVVSAFGEQYTHEMIVQGPGSAAQSEETTPVITSSCDYPIDVNSLEFGFPGMEKSINVGAIYADIYGGGSVQFSPSGTSNKVTWQLGDPTRANAIADALDAAPATDVQVSPGQYVHRILRNGAASPYSLYQFMNIETTHLGASGSSLNNGAVSSTFCAYAYALGGPP